GVQNRLAWFGSVRLWSFGSEANSIIGTVSGIDGMFHLRAETRRKERAVNKVEVRAIGATLILAAMLGVTANADGQDGNAKCPPQTRTDTVKDTYGTTVVPDPYRWLEDQDSKETRSWIVVEQKCTERALSRLPTRAAIAKRLTELYRTDAVGSPQERNERYFFSKRLANEDLSKIYIRKGLAGADELLVDPLPWSADHSASATLEGISA